MDHSQAADLIRTLHDLTREVTIMRWYLGFALGSLFMIAWRVKR